MERIALNWPIGLPSGWGVYGLNLAVELMRKGVFAVIVEANGQLDLTALGGRLLRPALAARGEPAARRGVALDCPVLQPLGDRLLFPERVAWHPGRPDIGVVFLEHVDIGREALARAADMALIVAGSGWNAAVLRRHGLDNVALCPQGVDLSLYHPAPRRGLLNDRFVVFSGGKLEYRKGQDIVIAAFRAFYQRHPDALLVCAWSNLWPHSIAGLAASPHVRGVPRVTASGELDLLPWLADNGLPPEAVLPLGVMRNSLMPQVLRECDLAVFPNRCEGGTNLAAMEAMACGVPVVLSANTGHLDLAGDHAVMLARQGDVAALTGDAGRHGWGESDVEELLAAMEQAYGGRAAARRRGAAGAAVLAGWSWSAQTDRLLAAVGQAAGGQAAGGDGPGYGGTGSDACRRAVALRGAGRWVEAAAVLRRRLTAVPADPAARHDLGSLLRAMGEEAEAERLYRQVLAAAPAAAVTLANLARLLGDRGAQDAAVVLLRRAVRLAPDHADYHWRLAWQLLLLGRWAEAWPHFEHRHAALGLRRPDAGKPRWDGRPVAGFRLLVLDEQGQGDSIQFARYLEKIPRGAGGEVIFAGKPSVLPLLRGMAGLDGVHDWTRPLPVSQAWVPLLSLPRLLGTATPAEVLPPGGWLVAEPARRAAWRGAMESGTGGSGDVQDGNARDRRPVVGLCWLGNADFPDNAQRSPGLAALRPLLARDDCRFVSLQVGAGRGEIAALGLAGRLADLGGAIEAAGCDFRDTAAVVAQCDLVISCCTSVVHVAGSLGRPTWLLLSTRPDWRWLAEGTRTAWYPGMTLFRQRRPGDWAGLVERVATRLAAWRGDREKANRQQED